MQVKKAVFPVAGLGSRFLPATKANPKEMLPVVDKPLIQYAVEEAIRAGITHMVFITSSGKRAIEDHFDNHFELETRLLEQNKQSLLEVVKNISPPGIRFTYVRQNQPLGLGHAILCAEHVIGDEPFAVLLADDLIDDLTSPCLSDMMMHFHKDCQSILAVQAISWDDVHQYGIVSVNDSAQHYSPISTIIEKPKKGQVSSNLAAVGRYVFSPSIFSCLKQTTADERGEIQLTDAISKLLVNERVWAYQFLGQRYDCGSKLGYLQATVELGLKHLEVGSAFNNYLRSSNFL